MATDATSGKDSAAESAERRLKMVNSQLRTADVTDADLLAAFMAVPREPFVAVGFAKLAYLDMNIPSAGAVNRKLLAPRTVGKLLQAAEVKPGDRALEVGGGSGYGAALLSEVGAKVVALESDPGAAAVAKSALAGWNDTIVIYGDLASGAPGNAPFDVILLNGAFEAWPQALVDQLAEGGRLVGLDARRGTLHGVLIEKTGAGTSSRALFDAAGDVLPGFSREASFVF